MKKIAGYSRREVSLLEMVMKKAVYWVVLLAMSATIILAQPQQEKKHQTEEEKLQEVKEKITTYMKDIKDFRQDKPGITIDAMEKYLLHVDTKLTERVLEFLKPYEEDTSEEVQLQAYSFGHFMAKSHPDVKVRQEMTSRLVKRLKVNDSDYQLWWQTERWLLDYISADFTADTKSDLHNLFIKVLNEKGNDPLTRAGIEVRRREISLIIGVANMQEEMNNLKKLIVDEDQMRGVGNDVGWAAWLARARMGSKPDIEKCIKLVEQERLMNKAYPLLYNLSYIRQPEVISVLKKYLESDERLEEYMQTEDGYILTKGPTIASYVAAYIAEMLDGFPIKKGRGCYFKGEIEICRKWMAEQKEWKIIR